MSERYNFFSFLAVISAIVVLACIAAVKGIQTDLAIMTGLIGVLGTFRPQQRNVHIDNPPNDPVPVDANQEPSNDKPS